MRNRTEHGFSWLTAISDAGSTPAASTNYKCSVSIVLSYRKTAKLFFVHILYMCSLLPTLRVYTRHSASCPKINDPQLASLPLP